MLKEPVIQRFEDPVVADPTLSVSEIRALPCTSKLADGVVEPIPKPVLFNMSSVEPSLETSNPILPEVLLISARAYTYTHTSADSIKAIFFTGELYPSWLKSQNIYFILSARRE